MKAKLIVNPQAGTESGPTALVTLNQRLREHVGTLDIAMTIAEKDATAEGRRAVEDGYDHVFVAGGDGTVNEVLHGVASVPGGLDAVIFGVIPLGTGNDFSTALGLPADTDAAIDMLLHGEPLAVDVGRLNGHHFINVSAGGFIAEVSDAVSSQLKSIAGRLAYLIGGAQALIDHEPIHTVLWQPGMHADEDSGEVALHAFAVCNSRLVGGGHQIAPDALADDGLLDVCLLRALPTPEFLALLRRVSVGEHVDHAGVIYFRTSQLELSFDRPIKVNTDGQVLDADRCRYDVLPRAARFLGSRAAASILAG